VPLAWPRRQEEKEPRAGFGRHGVAFVGLEGDERAGVGIDRLAAGLDARATLDDHEKRVFLDLVIAQLLARLETDENGARFLVRVKDDRGSTAVRRLDLAQLPTPHAPILSGAGSAQTRR
jgi:hypothetical protein